MKINPRIHWFAFFCFVSAQLVARNPQTAPARQAHTPNRPTASSAPGSDQGSKIDPAKEAAIRRLLDLTGGAALASQMMDGMQKNIKPLMSDALPPGDYRDKLIDLFFERFRSKANLQQLVDLSVQLYDKYLSKDEVEGLIQFYSTPLGQKTLSVLPKMMGEMQTESMKWGQDLGAQSMLEVLSEHPELRQAMEDAQKGVKAH